MKSVLKKIGVGLAVAVGLFSALFLPGLLGTAPNTEVATQGIAEAPVAAQPSVAPTEIVSPTASAVELQPAVEPTKVPAAIIIVAPTPAPPPAPTPEPPVPTPTVEIAAPEAAEPAPRGEVVEAQTLEPAAEPTATSVQEPTPRPTTEPTVEPRSVATVEPTATPVPPPTPTPEVTATPSPEPTAAPTVAPTATPTPQPTPQPTPTPTPEPTIDPGPTASADPAWMFVTSTDGLFLRDAPGGQIIDVLVYRAEVHVTGFVQQSGDRQWIQVDIPQAGWVALSFLTFDQPAPPPSPTVGSTGPSEPPTPADWAALRNCESGGRYNAVDPSGLYHGAYQFLPSTWDGLARRYWPELVGTLPSLAAPADQDKMAAQLYALEGSRPWPSCGRFLN